MSSADKRKYQDRREYLLDAVKKRRKKLREKAVDYKGGRCQRCGYDKCIEAFDFHHKDPLKKDFGISSKGYTRSWVKVKAELDKCIMLCANCHREVHAELAALSSNAKVKTSRQTISRIRKKRANSGKP